MHSRKLGSTGHTVSEIGFGAWGIGGSMWLGGSDEESRRAVTASLDLGVTFFDTALAYGMGHSERLLGELLARRIDRDGLVIATKIPPMNFEWPGRAAAALAEVFPAKYLVESVETSLRNLRVEALQVEQLHVWHDAWLDAAQWADTRASMARMVKEGKVLHWGISINDHAPETAMRLVEDPLIESVQVIYNIFDRSPERELFAFAQRRNLGVIVRVPFDEGALTGAIRPDTVFPANDWRHRYFQGDRRTQAAARADALKSLLGEEAGSLPELALRFCLTPPAVSTVIPGVRRPEHARANAAASDGRVLSSKMIARLAPHAWDKNWYSD